MLTAEDSVQYLYVKSGSKTLWSENINKTVFSKLMAQHITL